MPTNLGTPPDAEIVDIRFRNGAVVRGVSPAKWRWTLGDPAYPPAYAFDIVSWQGRKA
ncbi:MAG TPA: hypothetical protein VF695_00625 [Sphingomonas sp.]|jgi:hypothetical protein